VTADSVSSRYPPIREGDESKYTGRGSVQYSHKAAYASQTSRALDVTCIFKSSSRVLTPERKSACFAEECTLHSVFAMTIHCVKPFIPRRSVFCSQ
jgi:hypothetical protein